jgi:hypothetical protein
VSDDESAQSWGSLLLLGPTAVLRRLFRLGAVSSEAGVRQDGDMEAVGGPDLLVMLLMALGAALFVGNLGALTKPRRVRTAGELKRAPKGRSLLMAGCGLLVFVWGLASLLQN